MTEIRDEPTVEKLNENTINPFGGMIFNAVYRNADKEKAKKYLTRLSDKELHLFIHVCKMLVVLAENELHVERSAREGGAK